MPEPIGGFAAIMGKVIYPKEAMEAKIQGMVVVSGVINEKGNVISVKVEKSSLPAKTKEISESESGSSR
ncbi:MAG: TonB family protein [Ignavibacteriales bacterium]|nr:TonB family protein [Ignavibacteriales bacterium]